jgi:hypothetical protein
MAPRSHETATAALADFCQKAANQLAALQAAGQLSREGLRNDLLHAGLRGDIEVAEGTFTVKIEVKDDDYIPFGVKREDLKDSAIAKAAEEALSRRQREVWDRIRKMQQVDGRITGSQAVAALETLGYPEHNRPAIVTSVEAEVTLPSDGKPHRLSFTLDGKHEQKDVRARLEELAGRDEVSEFITAAFPAAAGLARPVRCAYTSQILTWPEYKDADE